MLVSICCQDQSVGFAFLPPQFESGRTVGVGGASTYMSVDVERISEGLEYIHEFWSSVVRQSLFLSRYLFVLRSMTVPDISSYQSQWLSLFCTTKRHGQLSLPSQSSSLYYSQHPCWDLESGNGKRHGWQLRTSVSNFS